MTNIDFQICFKGCFLLGNVLDLEWYTHQQKQKNQSRFRNINCFSTYTKRSTVFMQECVEIQERNQKIGSSPLGYIDQRQIKTLKFIILLFWFFFCVSTSESFGLQTLIFSCIYNLFKKCKKFNQISQHTELALSFSNNKVKEKMIMIYLYYIQYINESQKHENSICNKKFISLLIGNTILKKLNDGNHGIQTLIAK